MTEIGAVTRLSQRIDFAVLLRYFAIALVVPAVAIVLHELGHFLTHAAFGYEVNRLTFDGVTVGSAPAGVDPIFADRVSFAAGGLVSLALVAAAVVSVLVIGPSPVALGLVVFECLRASVAVAAGVARAGVSGLLTRGFGELRYLVEAFGGPGLLGAAVSWVEAALPFAALVFVLRRQAAGSRLLTSLSVFVGVIAGLALWLIVVGPRVLPR